MSLMNKDLDLSMIENENPIKKRTSGKYKKITSDSYRKISYIADELIQKNNFDYEQTYKSSDQYLARSYDQMIDPRIDDIIEKTICEFKDFHCDAAIRSLVSCLVTPIQERDREYQSIFLQKGVTIKSANYHLSVYDTLCAIIALSDIQSDLLENHRILLLIRIFLFVIESVHSFTIKLTDAETLIVYHVYKQTINKTYILEKDLISAIMCCNTTYSEAELTNAITNLSNIHCIEITDGKISLVESVYV